jgi:hypothetical protein
MAALQSIGGMIMSFGPASAASQEPEDTCEATAQAVTSAQGEVGPILTRQPSSVTAWQLLAKAAVVASHTDVSIDEAAVLALARARINAIVRRRRQEKGGKAPQSADLEEAEQSWHVSDPSSERPMCCVCLDDEVGMAVVCAGSAEQHSLCVVCLAHLTHDAAGRAPIELTPGEVAAEEYRVRCPVQDCDAAHFGREQFEAILAQQPGAPVSAVEGGISLSSAFEALEGAQGRLGALLERQRLVKEASDQEDAEMVRAQFRLADGTYNAWMCKRCGFGPVDHSACPDLRSHHGESRNGFQTSNACPGCDWFVDNRNKWPKWDGREVGVSRPESEWTPGVKSEMMRVIVAPYIPPDNEENEARAAERRRREQRIHDEQRRHHRRRRWRRCAWATVQAFYDPDWRPYGHPFHAGGEHPLDAAQPEVAAGERRSLRWLATLREWLLDLGDNFLETFGCNMEDQGCIDYVCVSPFVVALCLCVLAINLLSRALALPLWAFSRAPPMPNRERLLFWAWVWRPMRLLLPRARGVEPEAEAPSLESRGWYAQRLLMSLRLFLGAKAREWARLMELPNAYTNVTLLADGTPILNAIPPTFAILASPAAFVVGVLGFAGMPWAVLSTVSLLLWPLTLGATPLTSDEVDEFFSRGIRTTCYPCIRADAMAERVCPSIRERWLKIESPCRVVMVFFCAFGIFVVSVVVMDAAIQDSPPSPPSASPPPLPPSPPPLPPSPPSPPVIPGGLLTVTSGAEYCEATNGGACVTDGAGNYGDGEGCTIEANVDVVVTATEFDTESGYDRVTINGVVYDGTSGPSGEHVTAGVSFTWASDGSVTEAGFTICAAHALPPPPPP